MKYLKNLKEKKFRTGIKIVLLLCLTAIGGYGVFMAPASDQEELEQELQKNQKELQADTALSEQADTALSENEENTEALKTAESVSASAVAGQTPAPSAVTVIGDSVFLGAAPAYKKLQKNAVIDAKISRQVRHGLDVAKELKKKGKLGDIVIISLGINSPFNPATGQELIDYLGRERTIYWINAYGKNVEFQQEVNQTIQSLVDKNENVHLIPWAKEAKKHPDWFYQDGTHLNAKGQPGFARFVQKSMQ